MLPFSRRTIVAALVPLLVLGAAWLMGCAKSSPVVPLPLPPLSGITILPGVDTLQVGESTAFTAVALDTDSVAVSVPFEWTSTDPGVFDVTTTGLVLAQGEGSARLIAAASDKADTVTLHVIPAQRGWYAQASGVSNRLNAVFFQPDGRRGWAVGVSGTILVTRDAGVTWSRQNGASTNLNAVWFTSDSVGWIAGDLGALLHTKNAGATWTQGILAGGTGSLSGVWFATPDTGWVVGQNGAVVATVDAGLHWTLRASGTAAWLHGVSFWGTRHGWAVGSGGVILGTTDRGLTWDVVAPSVTGLDLRAVWRTSRLRANAVGVTGTALHCDDDGAGDPLWTLDSPGASYIFSGVCFATDSTGWAVGSNGTGAVLRTTNGGRLWLPQDATASAGSALNGVFFVDGARGWAVGTNGRILHTATGGLP